MSNEYNIDSLQSMEEIQHIRARSGWYIGEANDPRQLLSEIIDNSLDEAQNTNEKVSVIVEVDNTFKPTRYKITDRGRGIPIGTKMNSQGQEVNSVEFLSTKTLSGAKFDNETYKLRCLHQDTKLKLADGRVMTIKEFHDRSNNSVEKLPLMSCYTTKGEGEIHHEPILSYATRCELTKKDNKGFRVSLSNGKYVDCTYDHKFILRNGKEIKAIDLEVGDILLTMYHNQYISGDVLHTYDGNILHGYTDLEDIYDNQNDSKVSSYTDDLIDSWKCREDILYSYQHSGSLDQRIVTIPKEDDELVIKVERVDEIVYDTPQEFYDIHISDSYPNFLLDCGIIIHNSGLHGVGLCCCNALSDYYKIETRRDGVSSSFESSKGVKIQSIDKETSEPNGVMIEFQADGTIFESTTIPMYYIINRCEVAKAFGYDITLIVDGEEVPVKVDKLADLLNSEATRYVEYESTSTIDTGESVRTYLSYTSDTTSNILGYTNLLKNSYGGTHVRLLERAIEDVWWEYLKDLDISMKPSDARVGLKGVVAVFISHPAFSSQTKDKLTTKNKEIQPLIDKFKEDFTKYLEDNVDIREALIKRFREYRESQIKFSTEELLMREVKINEDNTVSKDGKKQVKRKAIVRGLAECTSPEVEGTEIFLVEGNSAGEGAIRIRDRKTQAILTLRGKVLNVTYSTLAEMLKSEDIKRIVNSVGVGIGENIDPSKCRYETVNILCDSDVDGSHIVNLVANVFIQALPDLVRSGKVRVVLAPLYSYVLDGKKMYTNEFEDIPKDMRLAQKFHRFKGLGEMDDDEFSEAILDKNNRISYILEYPSNIDKFNEIMGSTSGRRSLMVDKGILLSLSDIIEDTED